VHKQVIRLPFGKIVITNTVGDHKPPTIKFVPVPISQWHPKPVVRR
jgi:hypothetical protein